MDPEEIAAQAAQAEAAKAEAAKAESDKAEAAKAEASKEKSTQSKEGDDKPSLTDAEATLLKDNMSKKKALKDLAEKYKELQASVEGIDLEEAKKAISASREAITKELERKGEFDRLKEIIIADHKKEVSKIISERDEAIGEIKRRDDDIDNLTVGNAFSGSSFITNDTILSSNKARTLYGSHFEMEDGEIVAFDKPKGAKERTRLVDSKTGKNLGFNSAIEKIISSDPDKDDIIKSKIKPGAASRSDGARSSESTPSGSFEKIKAGLQKLKDAK